MSEQPESRETPENEAQESPSPEEQEAAAAAGEADRIQELEALAEERRDQALRAQAELENQRRRFERELENAHKYAMEKFASEMLEVCDSLEMGLQAARESQDVDRVIEGVDLTLKNLHKVFDKFGIQAEEPTGERFDPERHQAMSMQEDPEQPPNTVVATMQKGYMLQDRVLRPAMVMVSRAPSSPGIDENA
ncbi:MULTISPECIES: nucleotide exchange factor GrpE [unclassified Thioalkalivibrio]|uniref:nucleotide exchange factor GrpE n=1 Tax=unclassified Thioalkalivibrio TaxID=2621013 RepID=UPI00035FE3E6|nr:MULTISPECIES: nucleotide exchange factor GrpE [unclassified Thioalkalivibrio]PYG02626.1 molecular chaperone GrpE [Thioalkalivibrio sp. ALE21]